MAMIFGKFVKKYIKNNKYKEDLYLSISLKCWKVKNSYNSMKHLTGNAIVLVRTVPTQTENDYL